MSKGVSDEQLAELAHAVLELSRKLDVRTPALRDLVPLTGTEVAVIRAVHRHPRCTPSQVAELTGLKRSNVSTAIRTLEAGGLIVREHPAGDGRTVELVPTPLANENVERIRQFWADQLRQIPDDLLAEVLSTTATLARVTDAISD